jgi:hypothetical protein
VDAVEQTARTCLDEGYRLWADHRASAGDTSRRTPGGVYPHACAQALGEASRIRTQLLLEAGPAVRLTVHLRFLQVVDRQVFRHGLPGRPLPVDPLRVAAKTHPDWPETTERRWVCPPWSPRRGPRTSTVDIAAGTDREVLRTEAGSVTGTLVRGWKRLTGKVRLATEAVTDRVLRVTVEVENTSPCPVPPRAAMCGRAAAMAPFAFVSTHLVLHADTGAFLSLTDPPGELREAAAACRNEGTWPLLVSDDPDEAPGGPRRARDVLCSPTVPAGSPAMTPALPGGTVDGHATDTLLPL